MRFVRNVILPLVVLAGGTVTGDDRRVAQQIIRDQVGELGRFYRFDSATAR